MKRFVILGLTAVLAIGIMAAALAFAAPKKALAATDLSARGPSVGVDRQDNQFVFWEGASRELEEAVYTKDTDTWSSGAIDLRNYSYPMGSRPGVAVANFGGYGTHRFGAQFVFWRGTTNELWYAYWIGNGWNGPNYVPGVTNVADTPSAAFNSIQNVWGSGGSEITIFWQGTDGLLWYIRMTDPTGSQNFVGPHEATFFGDSLGTLGSAPGASNSSPAGFFSGAGANGQGIVTWKGSTNSSLWYVPYSISLATGDLTITNIAKKAPGWDDVNGGTSTTEEYLLSERENVQDWEFAWQDTSHDLEYIPATDLSGFPSPRLVPGAFNLGSAPSIGYWGGDNPLLYHYDYVFYKGQDGYLHEAYYNGLQDYDGDPNFWHVYSFPQYGTLG